VSPVSLWSIAVHLSAGHLITEQGRTTGVVILSTLLAVAFSSAAHAQGKGIRALAGGDDASYARLIVAFAALSAAPAVLAMMTSFARIVIVLFFLRAGIGNNQIPPNQVVIGLATFLTVITMLPTLQPIYQDALLPVLSGQSTVAAAGQKALPPMREYMLRHARAEDIEFFAQTGGIVMPPDRAAAPFWALAPAYMIGELRAAFIIGFVVYLPFLVVDLVVGATLASLGMLNVSAATLALPFKILLFIMVDGWRLLTAGLVGTLQ